MLCDRCKYMLPGMGWCRKHWRVALWRVETCADWRDIADGPADPEEFTAAWLKQMREERKQI